MKNLYFIGVLCCLIAVSCEKNINEVHDNNVEKPVSVYSDPAVYASLEDMRNAIYSKDTDVKSYDFVSYAETVMQEDGYSDLPWSINSERFASVLNVDGEVIFNDTFLKLCRYGIIYAPVTKIDKARVYASYETCTDLVTLAADIPSYLSKDDCTFSFIEDPDIFVYDSFGFVSDIDTRSLDTKVLAPNNAEFKEYDYDQEDILVNDNNLKWKRNFNVANASEQKINFTSKICNDTRIFQDNYGVYSESGVVTKTMKKNGLGIWSKFENQINAGITDLLLCEEGVNINVSKPDSPDQMFRNIIDINKFKIDIAGELLNRELTFATVRNYTENAVKNMTNGEYENLKEDILDWALQEGVFISNISGIRFFIASKNRCYIRLNDEEFSGVAKDERVIMNYFWGGARINGKESLLSVDITGENNIEGMSHPYHVQKVTMYGSSEYEGEEKGSKLIYNYDHDKYFN